MTRDRNKQGRRGQIILLFALFIGFLLGFSALAFDMAYAMVVRAQLVTALDAATLAAIRYASDGPSSMNEAAQRTFSANLPAGRLLVENPTISFPTVTPDNGTTLVTFTGSADIPTFFGRWFGTNGMTINAKTTAARRDRNVILVLDYSGSVQPVFDDIKDAAKAFVNSFSDTTDQVGLVIFSTAGRIEYAPQKPFKSDLGTIIDNLSSEAYTDHAMGMYYAYRSLLELDDILKDQKNNEIVFFTDGKVNWFPGRFNVQTGPCTQAVVDGVYGIGNGYYGNRVLSIAAPPSPGKPPVVPECPGWAEGVNALLSIQPLWYPASSGIAGDIFPTGIALAGFRNATPALTNSLNDDQKRDLAANVIDNLSRKVRQDTFLKPRIHTIGYEGNSGIDVDVLQRMANCGGCGYVEPSDAADSTQAEGLYVVAQNRNELMQAFLEVSGFIGRLTQ